MYRVVMRWWDTSLTPCSSQEVGWGGDRPAVWRVWHSDKNKKRDSASKQGGKRESTLQNVTRLPPHKYIFKKSYERSEVLFCILAKEEKKFNPGFDSNFCFTQYMVHE